MDILTVLGAVLGIGLLLVMALTPLLLALPERRPARPHTP
jgi:hypothetical protein